jgi:hypothetical protein
MIDQAFNTLCGVDTCAKRNGILFGPGAFSVEARSRQCTLLRPHPIVYAVLPPENLDSCSVDHTLEKSAVRNAVFRRISVIACTRSGNLGQVPNSDATVWRGIPYN